MARWAGGLALVAGLVLPQASQAAPDRSRVGVNGYFRVQARPDLQGGNGRLGFWNLYGRLLNEGPYAELDVRLNLLEADPGTDDPWTTAFLRIAGGSVANASPTNGNLGDFRLAQLFVRAGNVLIPGVTWQLGTQDVWFGDLGLYDFRPSTLFFDMLGLSARFEKGPLDVMLAVGDSGFKIRGLDYTPIITAGGYARLSDKAHVDFGLGGEVNIEPSVAGSKNAPYDTPGVNYEDWLRGEVVQRYVADNPGRVADFPDPEPAQGLSGKAVAYLGFGNFGPLRWNSLYATYTRAHPQAPTFETYEGTAYRIDVTSLTDERNAVFVGNEMQLQLIAEKWDLTWGAVYGLEWDDDNTISPSERDRWYASGVLRTQAYLTRTVHLIFETSLAHEESTQGNLYRQRGDSIFQSTDGLADTRGLEFGDASTRDTWQGKGGIILNPFGPGIYVRPSLRLLYGVQYSTQNNAFGNAFVESVSDLNSFGAWENHWHHVLGLEVEAWF